MSRGMRSRLFATQVMLNEASGGTALKLSQMQHDAVADLICRERDGYSDDVRSEVAEKLTAIKWRGDHLASLLGTLMPGHVEDKKKSRRWQDWPVIIHTYPQSAWDMFLDKDVPFNVKQSLVVQTPLSLGLRLPDEQTWHVLSSLLMAVTGGKDRYGSPTEKKALQDGFKKEYRRQVRRMPKIELVWEIMTITQLQANPLYADAYIGVDCPIVCPKEQEVYAIDRSWAIRGDSLKSSMQLQLAVPAAGATAAGATAPFAQSPGNVLEQLLPCIVSLVNNLRTGNDKKDMGDKEGGEIPLTFPDLRKPPSLRRAETVGVEGERLVRFGRYEPPATGSAASGAAGSQSSAPNGSAELLASAPPANTATASPQHPPTLQTESTLTVEELQSDSQTPSAAAATAHHVEPAIDESSNAAVAVVAAPLHDANPPHAELATTPNSRSVHLYEMLQERDSAKKEEAKLEVKRKRAEDEMTNEPARKTKAIKDVARDEPMTAIANPAGAPSRELAPVSRRISSKQPPPAPPADGAIANEREPRAQATPQDARAADGALGIETNPSLPSTRPLSKVATHPTVQHELTRSQFLCRTGVRGPGNSKTFPYGPRLNITRVEAHAMACAWTDAVSKALP